MLSTITHVKNGDQIDQYTPSQNPVACFKGKADEAFKDFNEYTYYVAYTPTFQHSVFHWHDMMSFLADHLAQTIRVRAYSNLSDLGEETFVELSLITQPHE